MAESVGSDLMESGELEVWLRKILGNGISRKKINALVDGIVAMTLYADTVEVVGARVGVETIEAYGLAITVDAVGNAERVVSLHGDFAVAA